MTGLLMLNVIEILIVSAVFVSIPFISRKELYFAVTVNTGYRASGSGKRVLKRYLSRVLAIGLGAICVGVASIIFLDNEWAHKTVLVPIFAAVLLDLGAYVAAHKQVRDQADRPAANVRKAVLVARPGKGGYLPKPPILLVLPYLILAGVAVWIAANRGNIPAQIPARFDAASHSMLFVPATDWNLFSPLVFGAAIVLLLNCFMFVAPLLRRLHATPARARTINLLLLEAMVVFSLIQGLSALLPLTVPSGELPRTLVLYLSIVVAAGLAAIVATAIVKLRGSRERSATSGEAGDRTPDNCWKLGLIYCNREDPAFWVEARAGLGYTVNFGHRAAIPFMAILVAVIAALTVLLSITR